MVVRVASDNYMGPAAFFYYYYYECIQHFYMYYT